MRSLTILSTLLLLMGTLHAAEYHVAKTGSDDNSGTLNAPFLTIRHAADLAKAGDVITVHEGIYRERVNPPRGGKSDKKRIIYQAAEGNAVSIKGSEVIKGWKKQVHDTWQVTLPNTFFGDFNPFNDLIKGDWFSPLDRDHHTGAVYLNGHWLTEAAQHEEVLKPADETPLWFAKVDDKNTTIWAQFKGVDPNREHVEINVRQAVFYPEKTGRNYITVRGFTLEHAATPWAPPTAEQIGLLGTHWSKGWLIENNTVRYSTCVGITLGKHGDEFNNTSGDTAEGYVGTIRRGLERGWSRKNIGSHVVRNNHIAHCEQAGLVGSLGAVFSTITGNEIHDIHVRKLFSGAEMAGIKIHGAIDMLISNNHIYNTKLGIWLDWMLQGGRVTGNLVYDSHWTDMLLEVNHGPFMIDNNLCLSEVSLLDWSNGGAYAHNIIAGIVRVRPQDRLTPYHKPHSTELVGLHNVPCGDDRFFNNMFVRSDALAQYNATVWPVTSAGNVMPKETKIIKKDDGIYLELTTDEDSAKAPRLVVTAELLGKTLVAGLPYVDPDGKPYRLDTDYFGDARQTDALNPGPFNKSKAGIKLIKVWPKP